MRHAPAQLFQELRFPRCFYASRQRLRPRSAALPHNTPNHSIHQAREKTPASRGGRSLRSFIHIRGVAKATLDIADKASPPDTFHLSTDQHVSIRSLVELICLKMGTNFEDLVQVSPDRPKKTPPICWIAAKQRKNLTGSPKFPWKMGSMRPLIGCKIISMT